MVPKSVRVPLFVLLLAAMIYLPVAGQDVVVERGPDGTQVAPKEPTGELAGEEQDKEPPNVPVPTPASMGVAI